MRVERWKPQVGFHLSCLSCVKPWLRREPWDPLEPFCLRRADGAFAGTPLALGCLRGRAIGQVVKRFRAVLIGWSIAATVPPGIAAQSIQGRLLDMVTNEAIESGILTLINEDGERVVSVQTDASGQYLLRAPEAGVYYIEARRLGYRSWIDGPVELGQGDDWRTAFHLRPAPVTMDPVEVSAPAVARRNFLRRVGFYERQRASFGHFMTREVIEKRRGARVSDVLSLAPGVRLIPTGEGIARMDVQLRGSQLSNGSLCRPRVYVDGIIAIRGDARPRGVGTAPNADATEIDQFAPPPRTEYNIDDLVDPDDIEAIEIYRSVAQIPVRFGGASLGTQCGVIAIWTRRGR